MQKLLLLCLLFTLSYCNAPHKPGQQLLDKTIAYHDPQHDWPQLKTHLFLTSTDTAGNESPFEIEMDNATGYFCHITHEDGKEIVKGLSNGKEFFLIDNKKDFSENDIKKYNLNSESVKGIRNFYGYLYGLPMKLTDKGAIVSDTTFSEQFNGKNYSVMHIEYDSAVGKELWDFYLNPNTNALEGYRFYYKGEPNEGEHIVLQDELNVEGIKIPKTRIWYLNKDNKYLGTDNLIKAEKLTSYRI